MDFGIFSLMGYRDSDKPTATVIEETIEQTRAAEDLGFGVSWFAEHHFSNYAICPSPLMMVAACARATKRIGLGTGVVLAPLYNPARLLSEIAFTDALTEGRLVLGIGSGYQPYEFERFNIDLADSKEMTAEFMDLMEAAFSQDFFNHSGKHYHLGKTHISPRPVRRPLKVYLAGDAPQLQQLAARHGFGSIIAGRTGGVDQVIQQRQRVIANFATEGVPADRVDLAIQRHCCVTRDRRTAEHFAQNALYQIRLTTALRRRSEAMDGTMLRDNPFPEEPTIDQIFDNLMIGDPELVAERLVGELRHLKPSHICFYFQLGDFAHRDVLRSMELFANEVVPLVERELGPLSEFGAVRQAA
jgi:alkanesulfonate monooxygenase SsuD/methylene tetrahydromethanopterin reductase-like flavin-dependent oxidoreductase (luciferase family)